MAGQDSAHLPRSNPTRETDDSGNEKKCPPESGADAAAEKLQQSPREMHRFHVI